MSCFSYLRRMSRYIPPDFQFIHNCVRWCAVVHTFSGGLALHPYGYTKLMVEDVLHDMVYADDRKS